MVFPLGALGFSQDRIDLKVDHISHLMGWVDRRQTNQMLWHYHMTPWCRRFVVHISCWLKHKSNLTLSSGDGDQFEHLLVLGPCVEHAHCKLGCFLHIIWVWTPLGPVTQKMHFFYEEIKDISINNQDGRLKHFHLSHIPYWHLYSRCHITFTLHELIFMSGVFGGLTG